MQIHIYDNLPIWKFGMQHVLQIVHNTSGLCFANYTRHQWLFCKLQAINVEPDKRHQESVEGKSYFCFANWLWLPELIREEQQLGYILEGGSSNKWGFYPIWVIELCPIAF